MAKTHQAFIIPSLLIAIFILPTRADYRQDSKATKASGGEDHTLVVTTDKGVWTCGPNGGYHDQVGPYQGVLGIDSGDRYLEQETLVRVHGPNDADYLEDILDIDAGWKHSLALDVNGFVWSWGWNSQGQLGIDSLEYKTAPVQVLRGGQADDPCAPSDYLGRIVGISAGRSGEHSLAVDANGYVYGWGFNFFGQCGNGVSGEDEREVVPAQVHGVNDVNCLENIIGVSGGEWHSMALEEYDPWDPNMDGRVYTWGDDDFVVVDGAGMLGIGDGVGDSNTPVIVLRGEQDYNEPGQVYLKHIVAISAGWDHSMAVEKYEKYDSYQKLLDPNGYTWPDPNHRGRVYTWGNNDQGWGDDGSTNLSNGGRLGNGSVTDGNSTPVLVLRGEQPDENPSYPYLSHIIAVSAGEAHSMALDVNGYVYTWGDNQHGQLGNGCTDPCAVPVMVIREDGEGYLENIVSISAGYWHSLAVDCDGVIWAWGKPAGGRLGLANIVNAPSSICNAAHRIPVVYNETQETFAFRMERAIEDANDSDLLVGTPGVYYEHVDFNDKIVTLEGEAPNNLDVVGATIINGEYNSQGSYADGCGVYFASASGSRLAGFTVLNAKKAGIGCVDLSSAYISRCVIRDSGQDGIYLNNTSADITNCLIQDNGEAGSSYDFYGVVCEDSPDTNVVNIRNCIIRDNYDGGIYCDASATTGIKITNNWIYDNVEGGGGSGINLNSGYLTELEDVVIRHNTIVNNPAYGIRTQGTLDINNCIIWGNDSGSLQYNNYVVTYSCIEGGYTGTGNINSDPCFVDADANDFHLDADSPCIDKGDPAFEADANETDIDGEERLVDGDANDTVIVDMGADEFYWSAADVNGNGLVNFVDYAVLAGAWGTDANDANYIEICDLIYDNIIDFKDINLFCDEWLWEAGWRAGSMPLKAGRSAAAMAEGLRLEPAPYDLAVAEEKPPIAKPLDIEELLDWLAEIWLDPDVRASIDAEDWLKFYLSLQEDFKKQ